MLRNVLVAAAFLAVPLTACVKDDPCAFGECASGVGDGGADGNGDATVGPPPGCDPAADPKDAPACVHDDYALFVDAKGSGQNPGTKAAPLPSVGLAVLRHGNRPRIYVCEGTYPEAVTVPNAVMIIGGFACGAWTYNAKRPLLAATGATTPALTVTNVAGPVRIHDFVIAGVAGKESSVAVFASNASDVAFVRTDMESAAVTVAGQNGTPQRGVNGQAGVSGAPAAAKTCTCAAGGTSVGGKGGDPADDGTPNVDGPGGEGGSGADCAGAGLGKEGGVGTVGADAPPMTPGAYGVLSAEGWTPRAGSAGGAGGVGQGGGGGANGGSGGCGGCGGVGGGGAGGGASVALLSFQSKVQLTACKLTAKKAGDGGDGAPGGTGGDGGDGGASTSGGGCSGGKGGRGGTGGAGGGGAGGVSAAILYRGDKPNADPATTTTADAPGEGGKGGVATNPGIRGVGEAVIEAR